MFSRFFINRPVFATVVSIIIVILGVVSYFRLPVAQYPDLAPPIVRVEAIYPGANAQTIADTIAATLEQEVNGVDHMIYMSSTSSDGRYALDVSFEPGTDVDMSAVLVQNRINIAEPRIPEEVRRQGITVRKQSSELVGVISLSSSDASIDDVQLSNYLAQNARDDVSRINGIGSVNILPAKDYSMRIWLDPRKLKDRNLTVNDVTAAVREQNVQVAAGAVGRPPAPSGTDVELLITTKGRLQRVEEFEQIILKRSADGISLLRLKDVGRIELATRDYSTRSTFNNKPNAVLVTYQLPGSNLVDVATQLKAFTERFQKRVNADPVLGGKVTAQLFYDASMFIDASLHEVTKTLIEAFVLVAIVVLVFLQSWRSTLIPLITIPVALIGTFVVLSALGFSVNMLTMFGLVLAIGIVVDDAIVVVENVERNLALDPTLSPKEATIKAMGEIIGPIVAITLVLMCVFIPTAALPGVTGTMYRQFALTIAASTFFSAVNALTLSPALCALLLRPHDPHHKGWFFTRIFNSAFEASAHAYSRLSFFSAKLWYVTIAAFVGTLLLTAFIASRIPTGFVPDEDLGFVVVAIQLPDGASLERTNAAIDAISAQLKDVKGISQVVTLSGFSVLEGQGTKFGNCWIVLDPWDERAKTGRSVTAVMNDIRGRIAPMREFTNLVFSLPSIRGLGNASGTDFKLLDTGNRGLMAQQQMLGALLGDANNQKGIIAFAFSSFRAGGPQVYLDIDREKVKQLNVPLSEVFSTLQTYLGSAYLNDFNQNNRTYQVVAQADAPFRLNTDAIKSLEVRSSTGQMIPLDSLMKIEDGFGPERIQRYNMYPAATIIGIPVPGVATGTNINVMEKIAERTIQPGSGFEYAWSNMSYQEKLAAGTGSIAFILGIVLVYLILAAQYESFVTPLAVVLSVPLVVIGAMIALWFTGLDNNVFTQIGLVLLIGLGAKNAILIVEFAKENRAKGIGIIDSAVEAAKTRFRPILMTSFAFILGVVPLMIATGAGASSRRSLGTAVFGGMVGATILGLIFTPALYVIVQATAEALRLARKPDAPKAPVTARDNVPASHG
jgi:hydrophobic/amphiphilic exporter-1 (mainly G- bacteria), HAE1 family